MALDANGNPTEDIEIEETLDKDAQAIIDKANGVQEDDEPNEDDKLPSDEQSDEQNDDDRKLAGKYANVDELKKGITQLKSELPQYVIDGMSEEALEQHYVELQKNFSSKKDRKFEKPDEKTDDEPNENEEPPTTAISKELWTDLSKEFEETGSITSEMYDNLEKAGIPSEVVDNYIDGLNSKQVAFTNDVLEIAGGQEQYDVIKEWAEDGNVDGALLEAMQTMSYSQILPIYKGIKAQFDAQNKEPAKRIVGDTNGKTGKGYTSQEAYMKDVADKRYGQNRAYTESVDKKFELSKF